MPSIYNLPGDKTAKDIIEGISLDAAELQEQRDYRNHMKDTLNSIDSSLKQIAYHLQHITDITGDEAKGDD